MAATAALTPTSTLLLFCILYAFLWISLFSDQKLPKLKARLVVDSRTQRPKGFGFVTFESDVDAQNALKAMNGRIVDGKLIFVEVAKTKDDDDNLR